MCHHDCPVAKSSEYISALNSHELPTAFHIIYRLSWKPSLLPALWHPQLSGLSSLPLSHTGWAFLEIRDRKRHRASCVSRLQDRCTGGSMAALPHPSCLPVFLTSFLLLDSDLLMPSKWELCWEDSICDSFCLSQHRDTEILARF